MKLVSLIRKEDDMYTAWSPDLDISSQGISKNEALDNLQESIELCIENIIVKKDIIKKININCIYESVEFEIKISHQ